MFEVPVPDEFLALRGKKHLTAAVAYDPPTRARRAEYLGVSLDFHVYWGPEGDALYDFYRTRTKVEKAPNGVKGLQMHPSSGMNQEFKWSRGRSTLQVARFRFEKPTRPNRWWLVVRVRRRWAPSEYEKQRFAVAVVLEAPDGDLYARVQAKLRARGRLRART